MIDRRMCAHALLRQSGAPPWLTENCMQGESDARLVLDRRGRHAVMGPEAAVNAVFYNRIQATSEAERPALIARLREEYSADVDLKLLASELVVDDIVPYTGLREELLRRFALIAGRNEDRPPEKKHGVWPV